jgi:glyoxylase-like metal-dependent hydrolase (beta-lactamase superfamily II)
VTITRIEEAAYRVPIAQFLCGTTSEMMQAHADSISADQYANGEITIAICCFVVESEGRRILVDTCVGPEHAHGDPASPLLDRLAAAGFPPGSIDAVVCSHFHFDHIGWNTVVDSRGRRPTFAHATYLFGRDEWEGTRDADTSAMLLQSVERDVDWVIFAGVGELVPSSHRVTSEVSMLPTFGHSPGHVSILIESVGQSAIVTGDAAHHPLQLLVPEVTTTADHDSGGGVASRRSLIDRALDNEVLIVGSHFGAPSAGFLRSGQHGIRFVGAT